MSHPADELITYLFIRQKEKIKVTVVARAIGDNGPTQKPLDLQIKECVMITFPDLKPSFYHFIGFLELSVQKRGDHVTRKIRRPYILPSISTHLTP